MTTSGGDGGLTGEEVVEEYVDIARSFHMYERLGTIVNLYVM